MFRDEKGMPFIDGHRLEGPLSAGDRPVVDRDPGSSFREEGTVVDEKGRKIAGIAVHEALYKSVWMTLPLQL